MRALKTLSSVAFTVAVIACGGSPAPPPAPANTAASEPSAQPVAPAAKPETKAPEPPKAPELAAPTVKVLEPGAAPRQALRYKFKAGVTEYASMDMNMTMVVTAGGNEARKVQMPTFRTVFRLDAKEITPEGDLRIGFDMAKVEVVKSPKIDPKLSDMFEKELAQLVGMKGTSRVSPRGVTTEIEFELPPSASPSMKAQLDSIRDSLRNMYMPLPEEEVGKGAKWEVTAHMPMSGAVLGMKTIYTLNKLTADAAQADVTTTLSAEPNQSMSMATLPPGAVATLESLSGSGTGKTSPSFTKLIGSGTNKIKTSVTINVANASEKMSMKMDTDLDFSIQPAKAPAAAPSKK